MPHTLNDRLLRPAAVHALRHVPADVPDLRHDEARTEQPARAHRADARDRGRRTRRQREFAEEMSYCLGCLACQTACPAGVNYAELFETARNDIETAGAHPGARAESLAGADAALSLHASARAAWRGPAAARSTSARGSRRWFGAAARCGCCPRHCAALEPQAPRVGAAFSNRLIAPEERPPVRCVTASRCSRAACRISCSHRVNRDTADVLLANGCAVDTPPVQPCCGSLHAHNGDLDGARILARRMIDLFPPDRYDAIITQRRWLRLAPAPLRSVARRRSGVRRKGAGLGREAARRPRVAGRDRLPCTQPQRHTGGEPDSVERGMIVTYHESCHLVHGQKIAHQPRALLALIPGVTLVPLPESTWCCGAAGVYAITQPQQAELLLARKVQHIVDDWRWRARDGKSGVPAADCAGSRRERQRGLRVVHPVSLLAAAYRAEGPEHIAARYVQIVKTPVSTQKCAKTRSTLQNARILYCNPPPRRIASRNRLHRRYRYQSLGR